jgi:hypothetical protein
VRPDDPETPTMPTNLSKTDLATILSALDGQPRNPANRDKALAAIGGRAAKLGLTTDEILDAAPGLLDGRLSPADWLTEITDAGQAKVERSPPRWWPRSRPGRPSGRRQPSPRPSPCRSSPGASASCWSTSPGT